MHSRLQQTCCYQYIFTFFNLSDSSCDLWYNVTRSSGRTNRLLFPLIRHGTPQKTTPLTILNCRGNVLTQLLPSNERDIHRQTHRQEILLLLRVFVATGKSLPSRCLAMKGGIHFTKPLPSNYRKDTHTHKLIGGIYEVRR
jgi:hypothetical protein